MMMGEKDTETKPPDEKQPPTPMALQLGPIAMTGPAGRAAMNGGAGFPPDLDAANADLSQPLIDEDGTERHMYVNLYILK